MTSGHRREDSCVINYDVIRNLTSQPEKDNGVQTWFANVSARAVLDIGTRDNLRHMHCRARRSKRNAVHRQIENTILEMPDRFIN